MLVEIATIDGPRGCECRALILAVGGICGLNDRSRGAQCPNRKQMVGSMAARDVKEGD